jgi:hypothetical protein
MSMLWADRSCSNTRAWIYTAGSFSEFPQALVAGQKPRTDAAAIVTALETLPERWTDGAALCPAETVPAGSRVSMKMQTHGIWRICQSRTDVDEKTSWL